MSLRIPSHILSALIATGFVLSMSSTAAWSADIDLAKMKVEDGLPKSLTGKPGDAKKGRSAAINRKKGNCLACHAMPVPEQADHGDIGPDLDGVASRLTAAEIRLRIVDPKAVNEDTLMPSFYRTARFHRVQKKWQGKTIISAQEVEDITAYLLTLKDKN